MYQHVQFTVPGEPIAKGRPRFSKYGQTYTPQRTAVYETLVRLEYERQCEGVFFEKGVPLRMIVHAYCAIPKATTKKKRVEMLSGVLWPTKRPDCSNLVKTIEDGLNGVAYEDDSQIVSLVVVKHWADIPHAEVMIHEICQESERHKDWI